MKRKIILFLFLLSIISCKSILIEKVDNIFTKVSPILQTTSGKSLKNLSDYKPIPIPTLDKKDILKSLVEVKSLVTLGLNPYYEPLYPSSKPVKVSDSDSVIINKVPDDLIGEFPYSAVGQLFIEIKDKKGMGSCSVIGDNLVLTAAHCTYLSVTEGKPKEWITCAIICLVDKKGNKEYFSGKRVFISNNWLSNDLFVKYHYDYAIIETNEKIPEKYGRLGIDTNQYWTTFKRLKSIGFPAVPTNNFNFDGKSMWENDGNFLTISYNYQLGIECVFTPGSSGGPWLSSKLFTNKIGYIEGLNSYKIVGEDNIMYTPTFTKPFFQFIHDVYKISLNTNLQ